MSDLALLQLIDALARQLAEDHLRGEASNDAASDAPCSNPVPLPDMGHAA
ncbi:hypothetical protein [Pseudoxanthomonas winnipegensis]|nr:hypothetical protein [Pseudoxanthomonas winnipegensis]